MDPGKLRGHGHLDGR